MNIHLALSDDGLVLAELKAKLLFIQQIYEAQKIDNELLAKQAQCDLNTNSEFQFDAEVKAEHQVPSTLLQPIMILEWKWDRITMDFVLGLPLSQSKKDAIWVVVDRLTKSAHLILVHTDSSLDKLAELYISQIVRLHGVPISIVSGRYPRFTLRFWKKVQDALGTKLHFSTTFHPQTDGQFERII
ncbi:hypothetical protein ES319_A03G126300v1 [Gossypium barbadense]|uniref:Integrase catalytic domain-containing protein n=1 Tax=Gossypium barbadense TaxID=3634 RepID=A0A5J5WGB8_GOSBA|nr:hypothetical protein ES319_A03G126300v1 [Gossypium barbadense]